MSTHYDPNVLLQFADELCENAKAIVIETAIFYGFIALAVSFFFFAGIPRMGMIFGTGPLLMLVTTSLGVGAGVSAGKKKAFAMRLQAQQILCQVQIEANTRQKYVVSAGQ